MHTVTRSAVAIMALSAIALGWRLGSAEAIQPESLEHGIEVYAERPGQVRLGPLGHRPLRA